MSAAPVVFDAADAHVARARVYRGLAAVFRRPDGLPRELDGLLVGLADLGLPRPLCEIATRLRDRAGADGLADAWARTFDVSSGPRCAATETSFTQDTAAHGLTRNVEMADIAGFYAAFGVAVAAATERPDHVVAELEFLHLVAVKEAVALAAEGPCEEARVCHAAAQVFLRDHLGRWAPRLAARLDEAAADPFYADAGRLLEGFVRVDEKLLINLEGEA